MVDNRIKVTFLGKRTHWRQSVPSWGTQLTECLEQCDMKLTRQNINWHINTASLWCHQHTYIYVRTRSPWNSIMIKQMHNSVYQASFFLPSSAPGNEASNQSNHSVVNLFLQGIMSRISRYLVRLYKLYSVKCPQDRPSNAFYLSQLAKPKWDVWYPKSPLGHNTLGKIMPDLMRQAGFEGYYNNHSLKSPWLHDAKVDEQLIMSRTGHSSADGARTHKRTSYKLKQLTSDDHQICLKHMLN